MSVPASSSLSARHAPGSHARVGPNAILQLTAALQSHSGEALACRVMAAAGLSHYIDAPPATLVAETEAARLFAALRQALPAREADAVLSDAGRRTADYVVANRIPAVLRRLLALLPGIIAVRLLLLAISAHAWTFAGSGSVSVAIGRRIAMTIADNPLATPGCRWHVAVLERLIEGAVAARARITHARVGSEDRFEVALWS